MPNFPFGVWGRVGPGRSADGIEQIKVERSSGGGFVMLTLENGIEYDTWIETLEEVEADIRELDVEWPADL